MLCLPLSHFPPAVHMLVVKQAYSCMVGNVPTKTPKQAIQITRSYVPNPDIAGDLCSSCFLAGVAKSCVFSIMTNVRAIALPTLK